MTDPDVLVRVRGMIRERGAEYERLVEYRRERECSRKREARKRRTLEQREHGCARIGRLPIYRNRSNHEALHAPSSVQQRPGSMKSLTSGCTCCASLPL